MWIKLQAPCDSVEQATAYFESRFGGSDPDPDRPGLRYVLFSFRVPRRLSECVGRIANWASVSERLPAGWESADFTLARGSYGWCESMSEDCDCQGDKGGSDVVYCSDLGTLDEVERRARKSPNAWRAGRIQGMRDHLVKRQDAQRDNCKTVVGESQLEPSAELFHCPVHREHHEYSDSTMLALEARLRAALLQMRAEDERGETTFRALSDAMAKHFRARIQAQECADALVSGGLEVPEVVYKYLPAELLDKGPPRSLRATQILALNDKMECNLVTMGDESTDLLGFLALVRSRVEEHLGIAVSEDDILERAVGHGDLRLSTFVQEFLNPRVGVISLSTDVLVPTMWSHYAHNTGIVVGYDTATLRELGLDLRPVHYSEMAPVYQPTSGDAIRLNFTDLERMEDDTRSGRKAIGTPILVSAELARISAGWQNLSRLLFTKGRSWAYEKEVRLLVDLQQARDTGGCKDGWPIKVIDIPPDAIVEICGSENTHDTTIERATQAARGDDR